MNHRLVQRSMAPFAASFALLVWVALAAWPAGVRADDPAPPAQAEPQPSAQEAAVESALAAYEAGNLPEAERRFRALADQRVPLAEFNLAMMMLRDELPRNDRRDAVKLLERAASGGFVRAEHALGEVHEQGLAGEPRDLALSNRWFELAARHGHVDAQVALATAYFLGRGAAKDEREAAHWYREAAKGGDVGAQYILASMYEHGDGVGQDLRLALYWYDIAARNGDDAASFKRDAMDAQLRGS